MLDDLNAKIDALCQHLLEDEDDPKMQTGGEDDPQKRLDKTYGEIEALSQRPDPQRAPQSEKAAPRKVRQMRPAHKTPSQGILKHGGEVFTLGQNVGGKRQLYGPGFKHVGWVDPTTGDKEIWGAGEAEPEYTKRTTSTYVPKVTGWEISWEDPMTGSRVKKFWPLPSGQTDYVQMRDATGQVIEVPSRIDAVRQSVTKLGRSFQIRQVRGKSQLPVGGEPGGASALMMPEPRPGTEPEEKTGGPEFSREKPLQITNAEFQALANRPGIDPAALDKLVQMGHIRIKPD